MDYDKAFLSLLKSEEDLVVARRIISPDMLVGVYADVYKDILETFDKYRFVKRVDGLDIVDENITLEFVMDKILERVRYNRLKEKIIKASKLLADMKIDEAERMLRDVYSIDRKSYESDISTFVDEFEKWYRKAERGVVGIKTPWDVMDEVTMGFQKGCLYVVASRTGIGKTWFLVLCSKVAVENDARVLFVSCEIPKHLIAARFYCLKCGIPYSVVRKGKLGSSFDVVMKIIREEIGKLEGKMFVSESGFGFSIMELRYLIDCISPDIVMVDGLYLIKPSKRTGDRYMDASAVVGELKSLAIDKKVPIVATTQFNRHVRGLKASTMNLSLSDETGWDADGVFGLLRTIEMEVDRKMFIKTIKARESEPIDFYVKWDIDRCDFNVIGVIGRDYEDDSFDIEEMRKEMEEKVGER